ncbi:Fe-S cluster assembly protein SufD [Pseudonocardia eucalypti]|uniref:Fe-S cluster assembly protein SufD n=1 Tax=Pseudonocardia eucalypti TaxID=648755 RepID=A0ABP9RA84_9PSEU|nr:Fe-S cluster assembly protein SufD [Pseudonocardia eucalypti]
MTSQEVAGLAPELAGAKEGSGVVPMGSAGERFTAYDVEAFEVPSGREENWRFTPMRRLRGLHNGSASVDGEAAIQVTPVDGVTVETAPAADPAADPRFGEGGAPADRVAALAWSGAPSATLVTLDGQLAEPVTVTVAGPGEGRTALAHLQLRANQHAEAVVVLDYTGAGTVADNVEVVLADGAHLTLVVIDDWAADGVHVGAQHLLVGRDATLRATTVSLGGDLVRISPTVRFAGPGGDAELTGLSFADAGQHLEHRLLVDHAVPHCRSNVVYKSALQGDDAHTVWIGDVLIRAEAEGTETFELNRNLLLSQGARADSVPNLEIETGEIAGAGHASATGRFDDEQLFYLRSRGIPEAVARRLVVRGFFNEIINKISVPAVRERLEAAVEEELAAIDTASAS